MHKKLGWLLLVFIFLTLTCAACGTETASVPTTANVAADATPITTSPIQTTITTLLATTAPIQTTMVATSAATRINPVATTTGGGPSGPTRTPLPREDWHTRCLNGIPCLAPCWEGITPGKTTAKEAVELLKKNPLVTEVKQNKVDTLSLTYDGYVSWKWSKQTDYYSYYAGELRYKSKSPDQFISEVRLFNLSPVKLGEAIKVYGEPSHIYASSGLAAGSSYYYYGVDIYWIPQGVRLSGTKAVPYKIDASTDLDGFEFVKIDGDVWPTEGFAHKVSDLTSYLAKWQGYQDFSFYCKSTKCGELK